MLTNYRRWLAFTAAAALLALAGCGMNASSSESAAAPQRANRGAAPGAADKAAGGTGGAGTPAKLPPAGNVSVIYTADVTVRSSTVDKVADQAVAMATTARGLIGSERRSGQGMDASATLVLRVPPEAFYPTVAALAKLGTQPTRTVSSQDVSGQVIDLDARIHTAQASLDRTRTLFARAQQISDIVTLEGQLTERQTALETLQAQKKALDSQIALSTISFTVSATPPPPAQKPAPGGFLGGLIVGWNAFLAVLNGSLAVFGALLPFLIVLGAPAAIIWWFVRRRTRRVKTVPESE
ncbi:DUF4349 domain-containing protein [Fodinicola acaciae]|uniref:DUF4349 domain-containing protein n=1 Tax=Fodinicola acaciae TaxID=2681555 RepID=UPI0013CFA77D|nr:DUF4349 domain-containing protein [Fodinicola acaciae]